MMDCKGYHQESNERRKWKLTMEYKAQSRTRSASTPSQSHQTLGMWRDPRQCDVPELASDQWTLII